MAKDTISDTFSKQLDNLYNNIVGASNSKNTIDKKNKNKFGNASAYGDQGAAHVAGSYINALDNRSDVSDEKTADAANKMAATLATNGTGTTTAEDLNNAMNEQKKEFGSDKDMSYDDDDLISATQELFAPSEGNSHNTARRAVNALTQLANAPGQLIGNGLDAAFDGIIGNAAGFLFGDEAEDSVKNAFNGDDLSIIGDIGTDIGLMALGPAGWALMAGKNIAQHGNDIADVVAGEDYLTGQDLDGLQVAGRLGSTLLDAAVPIRAAKAAKGATKVAEKVAGKADDAAKAVGEAAEEAATEGAEKAVAEGAKEAIAEGAEKAATKEAAEAAAKGTEEAVAKVTKYEPKHLVTKSEPKHVTADNATNKVSDVLNNLLSGIKGFSSSKAIKYEPKHLATKGEAKAAKLKANTADKLDEDTAKEISDLSEKLSTKDKGKVGQVIDKLMSNSGEEISEKELKALIKDGAVGGKGKHAVNKKGKAKHASTKTEENGLIRQLSPEASAYARNNGLGPGRQAGHIFNNIKNDAIFNSLDAFSNAAKNGVEFKNADSLKQVIPNLVIASLLGRTPTSKKHSNKSIAEALGNKATKAKPYKKTSHPGKGKIIDPKRRVARHAQNVLTRDALGRYGDLYGLGNDEMSTGQLYDQMNDIFSGSAYEEEE